jgi:DNA primase
MERGTSLFNHTALLQETDVPLIVVEGVFDAIPHLPHAAALLGKPTDDQIALLATTQRPVAFALDGDAWEEGWAWAEHLRFKGVHAGSVKLPPGKDPNDISPTWLARKAKESIKAPEGQ